MNKDRWQKISGILDELLNIEESDRIDWLHSHYGNDRELFEEIKSLLTSIEESEKTNFLESARQDNKSLIEDLEKTNGDQEESLVGKDVGPYCIESLIDKGGMGSVYKAVRTDGQFEQTVAIKFINRQNSTETARSRFRLEQEILANLKHPNIAMLFDGGVTEDGYPYLIMEYVEGIRIDHYCRENRLNIDQRLDLFKKILKAIDYAHSNLVVHRDLKPTNILVTNSGEVKILDFGIAKLMSEEITASSMVTQTGQRLWTPQYAAPEQVLEKPAQLQTDVYSLGILLYLLLTDTLPFEISEKSIYEVEKTILENSPDLMSQTVRNKKNEEIKKSFGVKKYSLLKELVNDLDAIVDKAIRKEPEYRYSSVSIMLDDIERYENNLPVSAKKGSFAYNAKKFIGRHTQSIVVTVSVILLITATVFYYTLQLENERNHAEQEAVKSQQMSEFLVGIFESANAHTHDGMESGLNAPIGEILDHSISMMDEELADQPVVKASLKTTLGKMYLRLGEFDRAEVLTTEAVESLNILDTDTREELASAIYELARVHQETGNVDMADSLLLQAIEIHESTENGLHDDQALTTLSMYGSLQWFNRGDFNKADSVLSKTLRLRYEHLPDKQLNIAASHNDLAAMNHARGNFRMASENYEKAIELYRAELGTHPAPGVTLGNYSILLREYHRLDEAEQTQREALQIHLETTGETTIDTGLGYGNLANIQLLKGNIDEADSLARKSYGILTSIYGEVHPFVARTNLVLANIEQQKGNKEAAELIYKTTIEHYSQVYPPDHSRQSDPLLGLGELYMQIGEIGNAIELLSEAYKIRKNGYSENSWRTAVTMRAYGEALAKTGETEKAKELLNRANEILYDEFGDDHIETEKVRDLLSGLISV